ncbi:MAG: hypothetical protein JXA99_12350 [Candidatus Lokiarchaeota archaeon]|nr:hypothetical protein [Candidatus Lokiarchaeota archaeon]
MIFSSFLYHGIFLPPSHKEGFVDGFISYLIGDLSLGPAGDMDYSSYGQSAYTLYGYDSTTDLMYIWIFMGNSLIASEIVIAYQSSPQVFQYYATLEKQSSSIPFGNTFLLFLAAGVISLIYLSQKRINKK